MKSSVYILLLLAGLNLPGAAQPSRFSLRPVIAVGATKTWGAVSYEILPAFGSHLMVGLDAGYRLASRLEIGTGLAGSNYNTRYCKPGPTDKQGDYDTIGRQRLTYLQVPLSLRFYTKGDRTKRWVGLLEVAVIYNILLRARSGEAMRYTDRPVRAERSNTGELNSGGFSLLISPGWRIPLGENMGLDLSLSGVIGLSPMAGEHVNAVATGVQRRFPNVAFPTTIGLVRFGLWIGL